MTQDFRNRLDWRTLALAFTIWTAHFMAVWSVSIIFPAQAIARWIAVALTLAAFAALFAVWKRARDAQHSRWTDLAVAIAAGAVAFDTLPALIG